MRLRFFLFGFILLFSMQVETAKAVLTPDEALSSIQVQCTDWLIQTFKEEQLAYRNAQYAARGSAGPTQVNRSVLSSKAVNTTDLVPYLVLNYHAFSCRLQTLCDAVAASHGHLGQPGPLLSYRPLGCSRLFAARGRWWTAGRRDVITRDDPIEECNHFKHIVAGSNIELSYEEFSVDEQCNTWVDQILSEERQMLRLLASEDSAHRGTRKVVGVFQAVISDIRESFLEPLRGLVDLFGSVLYPIPCLLPQCN
jgi:hypothetical protein